jgi:hypothetical protein
MIECLQEMSSYKEKKKNVAIHKVSFQETIKEKKIPKGWQ